MRQDKYEEAEKNKEIVQDIKKSNIKFRRRNKSQEWDMNLMEDVIDDEDQEMSKDRGIQSNVSEGETSPLIVLNQSEGEQEGYIKLEKNTLVLDKIVE